MDESESSMMLAALSLSSHQDKDKSDTITRLLEEIVALKIVNCHCTFTDVL
jgi:hypothetical protein